MKTDLESQIRGFAEVLGSSLPLIDADEVITRPVASEERRGRRRGWVVAIGAAALVLALGVPLLVLMPRPGGEPALSVSDVPVVGGLSDLPSLHALHVTTWQADGTSQTIEVWFQDESTWRQQVVVASSGVSEGSLAIREGDWVDFYDPSSTTSLIGSVEWSLQSDTWWAATLFDLVPPRDLADRCGAASVDMIGDRVASHFQCPDTIWEHQLSTGWTAVSAAGSSSEYWVDEVSGLVLASESGMAGATVRRELVNLEVAPVFPPSVFVFDPVPESCGPQGCGVLIVGASAPVWEGPLLDGTLFRLEDLRGRPTIVFRWGTGLGPGVLESMMGDFQTLYDKWSAQIGFVSAPENAVAQVRPMMEEGGYTFPTVTCFDDDIFLEQGTNNLCEPEDVGTTWGIGYASWVILDSDGRVQAVRLGHDGTFEELDRLLATAVGET